MKKAGTITLKIIFTILAFFIAAVLAEALTKAAGAKHSMGAMALPMLISLLLPIWSSSRIEWKIMSALGGLAAVACTWLLFYLAATSYVIGKVGVGTSAPPSVASTASYIAGLGAIVPIFVSLLVGLFLLNRGRRQAAQTEKRERVT